MWCVERGEGAEAECRCGGDNSFVQKRSGRDSNPFRKHRKIKVHPKMALHIPVQTQIGLA
jgi:hypothetical protein